MWLKILIIVGLLVIIIKMFKKRKNKSTMYQGESRLKRFIDACCRHRV